MRLAAYLCCVFLLIHGSITQARVLKLRPGGDGDAPSIQAAIAVASAGDTILLANGTYSGDGNRDVRVGPVSLTVRSMSGDPESCIIDCGSLGRGFLFESESPFEPREHIGARLEGVTITNGRAETGGAIVCGPHSCPTITNCVLHGNRADEQGGAVHCETTDDPRFVRCIIVGNSAGRSGGGVSICCCGSAAFENCTIVANAAPEGSAFSGGLSGLSITRSIIAFHQGGTTFQCGQLSSSPVTSCDVYGNAGGDGFACLNSKVGADGNVSVDPRFRDAEKMDFRLLPKSPLRPAAYFNPQGIGARTE